MPLADIILTHGTVVTMGQSYTIIPDGAVVIQSDTIIAIGTSEQIAREYQATETVDCRGQAIIPGLINAHTHVPMTLLRGLADDRRLDVWLIGYMMPTEREFVNPDFVRLGTLLGCAEMIKSGITTFNDMYYFEDSVAAATVEAGLRAICGQTVLKYPTPDAASYEESLQSCRDFIIKWKGHSLIIPAVAPHAPYTCTPEILQACASLATEFDVPLHIHISETSLEVLESRKQYGMPVVPWVKKQGLLDARVIAAHCVHVDDGEMHTLKHHNIGVAHNPTSNLKLASGIAPVRRMLELGLKVGIGTDGSASNNDLDLFEETRLAALIAKVATDDPTTLPAKIALAMATNIGAQALHIEHLTGSIEPGKRADLAIVDLEKLHNWPHFNRDPEAIYSRLVYAAKSSDVQHVLCNGQWLMRDRQLLTIDTETLTHQASEIAHKIDVFLSTRENNILSKLLAIGELQQEESFEIQVKVRVETTEQAQQILDHPGVSITKTSHYRQHDTYFGFTSPTASYIRYREDDYLDERGHVYNLRARLTFTEDGQKQEIDKAILLSRSRYISPATRPLRFYREYFQAQMEHTIVKERWRWHTDYKGLQIYINIDQMIEPPQDCYYLEIKSRTWSLSDAKEKANAILELLAYLGIQESALVTEEYLTLSQTEH
ncbi:MAG: amidohydrolase [Anaerolineae bacterium]|nr:amidohydrolase [Anaerolineae bacterium]